MTRNIHPADELALVRSDIRRLKEREEFLRRGFLGDKLPRHGAEAVVEVNTLRNKRFLRDRLPPSILEDPSYWTDARVQHVCVRPR